MIKEREEKKREWKKSITLGRKKENSVRPRTTGALHMDRGTKACPNATSEAGKLPRRVCAQIRRICPYEDKKQRIRKKKSVV